MPYFFPTLFPLIIGIGPDYVVPEPDLSGTQIFLDQYATAYDSSRSYSISIGPPTCSSNGPIGQILGAVDPLKFEPPPVLDMLYRPDTLGHYYLLAQNLTLLINEKENNLPFPSTTVFSIQVQQSLDSLLQ